jgi:dihydroflavonol-4-reductase
MIIVTGATGHLGNVLVKRLVKDGHEVGILVHNKPPQEVFGDLPIKVFIGDVTDETTLIEPFKNADVVYHMAAKISISSGEFDELQRINVGGAKNVVKACLENGVKKLIYASSVHALVETPHGTAITEVVPNDFKNVFGDYAKSKVLAYKEIMNGFEQGLNVVAVFPSGIIGPFDYKPSQIGQIIKNFLADKSSSYFDGEYDYVDVRDVVEGILLATAKGRAGQGYILNGNISTVQEIYKILGGYTNIHPKLSKIPLWFAYFASYIAEAISKLKHEEPLFTPYSVAVLQSNPLFSTSKTKEELGYSVRPIEQTLHDAVDWHQRI